MFGRIFGKRPTGLTKRQFTDIYVDGLRQKIPNTQFIVPYELAVMWLRPGEKKIMQDLTFLWEAIQGRSIDFQKAVIVDFVDRAAARNSTDTDASGTGRGAGEAADRFDVEHVLPVIRRRDRPMTASGLRHGMPHRTFAGDLVAHCVFDHASTMSPVSNSGLRELGIDEDALWARAFANLGNRRYEINYGDRGVGYVMQGDDYESSLILDERFWSKIERDFGGEHLAMVPCANTLIFARPDSDYLVEALKHAREIFLEADTAISTDAFCRRSGVWQVWPVPEHLKPQLAVN